MTSCADCGASTGRRLARYCDPCRPKHRGKRPKHVWTEGRIAYLREHYSSRRGVRRRVARTLGFPAWCVQRKAAELGLTTAAPSREWTEQEVVFLLDHCGTRSLGWMAKRLRRTVASVELKIKRLHLSRRITEGYTLRELELCFGVDHHKIERWVERGWLTKRRRGLGGPRDGWAVTDADVLRFVIEHPTAFDLRRVDQTWFLGLLLGQARRALREAEAA